MPTDAMNPATAVTWGPFIQAAYDQYVSDPGQSNPAAIKNMPAGYTLVRTIQMSDFFGFEQSRVFYGFVAVGGDPRPRWLRCAAQPPPSNGGMTCIGTWCRSPRFPTAEKSHKASTTSTTRLAP